MYICLCRGLTTSDIVDELEKRQETVCRSENGVSAEFTEEIHTRCSEGLGYNCGMCSTSVKETIDTFYAPRPCSGVSLKKSQKSLSKTAA